MKWCGIPSSVAEAGLCLTLGSSVTREALRNKNEKLDVQFALLSYLHFRRTTFGIRKGRKSRVIYLFMYLSVIWLIYAMTPKRFLFLILFFLDFIT